MALDLALDLCFTRFAGHPQFSTSSTLTSHIYCFTCSERTFQGERGYFVPGFGADIKAVIVYLTVPVSFSHLVN